MESGKKRMIKRMRQNIIYMDNGETRVVITMIYEVCKKKGDDKVEHTLFLRFCVVITMQCMETERKL